MATNMPILYYDYETRSRCDLPARGAYNYAKDPSTEILCMCWAIDDGDVQTWVPGQPIPDAFREHIADGHQLRAHNAAFERLITWYVLCPDFDLPEPKLEQFYCTATQMRANGLPGSLEDAARASGSSMQKDYRGGELIRKLSLPQANGQFLDDPELMAEMIDYCAQDVRTMRAVSQWARQLTDQELREYWVSELINDKGILLDKPLADAAVRYSADETEEVQARFFSLTGNTIATIRSPKVKDWVMARVGPEALALMVTYKDGEKKYTIDKTARANLLALADEYPDQVPEDVAEVIGCLDAVWASSVAKFSRMSALADVEDCRIRGAFVMNGASQTGRYASKGAQLHNYPRKTAKEPQRVRDAIVAGESIVPAYGRMTTEVLKSMLRPSLLAKPGHSLIIADWAGVEARGLPWLTNNPLAEPVLDTFRRGDDIYIAAARGIYHKHDISPDERQIGKVVVLACGYGGGHNAFTSMGKNYNVVVAEAESRGIVSAWRAANPWAPTFWQQLESAAMYALRHPGQEFAAGRVLYYHNGQHLWCMLPSGRIICYPFAKRVVEDRESCMKYLKASWKPAADATEWPRAKLYGGLAAENVTQAVCADLLRWALVKGHDMGLPIVGHVHDEIILEAPDQDCDIMVARLKKLMISPPPWAEGFPLDVDIHVKKRYSK